MSGFSYFKFDFLIENNYMRTWFLIFLSFIFLGLLPQACTDSLESKDSPQMNDFYPNSKPGTRWWWFASEIKKEDVRHQLNWMKSKNFGAVEIAWVYPLYRYQRMYAKNYNRHYPKDTSAQEWLSRDWSDIVAFTKSYADSIGMACDFTFGSAWPVAGSNIGPEHSAKVYGDTSFRQTLTFAWCWPDTQLVIDHLNAEAFAKFAEPIEKAMKPALAGSKSAFFTDSWEIKLNSKYKIWTDGFAESFWKDIGYDLKPFMEQGLDSFPDVRYDYMLHLEQYVIDGFYKPYVEKCKEMGAWSRVQCLASPTDVMTTYSLVDIPETECMLNNPNYSRIVSSSACLASKPIVSCETFTCMYGFPATYLREEQTADLKMVIDAMFAQGVNQHFYHGTPYNPIGSDSIEFFATTYFGPGGSLDEEMAEFNKYVEKVSGLMQIGKSYSDIAVYIPYEDGVMQGAYPKERQRVWVWGEYEMRYIDPPKELEGYHPLWINRHFLESSKYENGKLHIGDARFSSLYIGVKYLDVRSLDRILELAKAGLKVCLQSEPLEPGLQKDEKYESKLLELMELPNVSNSIASITSHEPLVNGEYIPSYWCKVDEVGNHYLFIAQKYAKGLVYPVYCGQSMMDKADVLELKFNVNNHLIEHKLVLDPYQSAFIKIDQNGHLELLDIEFIPKDPIVRPKEKQRMYF